MGTLDFGPFLSLPEIVLGRLLAAGAPTRFSPGETLVREGDPRTAPSRPERLEEPISKTDLSAAVSAKTSSPILHAPSETCRYASGASARVV